MQDDERQPQMDDALAPRSGGTDTRTQEVPVSRMTANPRRVRRA